MSFFSERMALLGVTPEKNVMRVFNPHAEAPMSKSQEVEIFSEDKDGNIRIQYWDIEGKLFNYLGMGDGKMSHLNARELTYHTTRLQIPDGDRKYRMPKGQGSKPWFAPELVRKYKEKERIKTLYLTEGVFKAWKGNDLGLDVVGLSSITHYKDRETNSLHTDIVRLIQTCGVEQVVILWDGDCLHISERALEIKTDLCKRPVGFYSSAKAIQEILQKIPLAAEQTISIYFMHPNSDDLVGHPKGLDDLLIWGEKRGTVEDIVREARALNETGNHFCKFNITRGCGILYRWFALHDKEVFYQRHMSVIGEEEFYFFDDLCQYNGEAAKLKVIKPGWSEKLRWIGDEFFEELLVPGAIMDRRQLIKYNRDTLQKLYGQKFHEYLEYYAGFCNVPDHFAYRRDVEVGGKKFYNVYFPFYHEVREGNGFPTILRFLEHIFGIGSVRHPVTGIDVKTIDLGLDYIQLLLLNPTQILPVICLFSQENNTGKSTFGNLLTWMFGDNAVQIGNSDMQSDFNDVYAGKLIAICEETLLERKKDVERIKALSTSKQITVNPKGQRQYTIDFFCKFLFFSNNRRMIYVTKHDERFWIIQVPRAKADDPELMDKMKAELPAFTHFLKTRKLVTERESRMWFHGGLIRTEAFYNTVKVNEPAAASDLREAIYSMFLDFPGVNTISMPMANIRSEFFKESTSQSWIMEILKDYLNVEQEKKPDGKLVVRRGEYKKMVYKEHDNSFVEVTVKTMGRHYVFKREEFCMDVEDITYEKDWKEQNDGDDWMPDKEDMHPERVTYGRQVTIEDRTVPF